MSLADMEKRKQEVIRQCLEAAAYGPFFPEWEFHTLFGLDRNEVEKILQSWPQVDEQNNGMHAAITNVLNNLLFYPHGREKEWSNYISASHIEVEMVLNEWRKATHLIR